MSKVSSVYKIALNLLIEWSGNWLSAELKYHSPPFYLDLMHWGSLLPFICLGLPVYLYKFFMFF